MGWMEAISLAVLQGLTEFLPVSSSGHLGLLQRWFASFRETDLTYAIVLHLGTALALVVYFRRDLLVLARGLFRPGSRSTDSFLAGREREYAALILIGSLPTVALGLGLRSLAGSALGRPGWIAAFFLITGTVLAAPRLLGKTSSGVAWITPWQALLIGTAQGFAVLPGISRSGSTIVAGILVGVDRNLAARFSFHLSLPAVFGAALLEAGRFSSLRVILNPQFLGGFLLAAAIGYLAIGLLRRIVAVGRLEWFSFYCWGLGTAVLVAVALQGSW